MYTLYMYIYIYVTLMLVWSKTPTWHGPHHKGKGILIQWYWSPVQAPYHPPTDTASWCVVYSTWQKCASRDYGILKAFSTSFTHHAHAKMPQFIPHLLYNLLMQRVFNDLKRNRLSFGRMIRLLAHPLPPPLPSWTCLSFSVFLCVAGRA